VAAPLALAAAVRDAGEVREMAKLFVWTGEGGLLVAAPAPIDVSILVAPGGGGRGGSHWWAGAGGGGGGGGRAPAGPAGGGGALCPWLAQRARRGGGRGEW